MILKYDERGTYRETCYKLATSLFRAKEPHGWLKTMKLIDQATDKELEVYKKNMEKKLNAFDKALSIFLSKH